MLLTPHPPNYLHASRGRCGISLHKSLPPSVTAPIICETFTESPAVSNRQSALHMGDSNLVAILFAASIPTTASFAAGLPLQCPVAHPRSMASVTPPLSIPKSEEGNHCGNQASSPLRAGKD